MTRNAATSSHHQPTRASAKESHDLAAAAGAADLQSHHQLLLCLEQTRRAQMKLAKDWAEDLLATTRMLASSTDPQRWLQAPACLLGSASTHLLAAQGSTLSAWSELQNAVLDDVRSNIGGTGWVTWPYVQDVHAGEKPLPARPTWLEGAMKTYGKFAAACGSVWAPSDTVSPGHH